MGDAGKYDFPLKSHHGKKKKNKTKQNKKTLYNFYFSNVNVFIISYYDSNFIEKFLWESGFSYFCRNWNDAKRNRSLATILKRFLFFWGGVFFSWKWLVYEYIQYSIHHKITTAKWFLGSHGGTPAPTGGKYLSHFSGICKKPKVCRGVCRHIVNNKPN